MKQKLYIDLCDTLVKGNTTLLFVDSFLSSNWKYKIVRRVSKLLMVRIFCKLMSYFKYDIRRLLFIRFLFGFQRKTLLQHARKLAQDSFEYNIEIIDLIETAKQKNCDVYIISASLDFIVEAVSEKFDVRYLSTELEYKHGICLGRFKSDLLFSKKDVLQRCSSIDHEIVFISDNIQDIEVLTSVIHGFGIYNDKNREVFSRSEIKEFIYSDVVKVLQGV
ncbi:HAD family hydrolase [Wohlfahrtiimonas chitiniclastica]|uniref:HAD family hydrolase n=1 Tax=Wohlfahrtiimonas chitiniclastica TaxID=400946 RepID=UPI001BCBE7A2|nr:HAD family hydrolase [Wohlfahrtiimonas chitiniclastica]MBS7818546.1 haloacid dehalogenase-like hydrolase [Wohlfahrtiimonas chitiniclastica]